MVAFRLRADVSLGWKADLVGIFRLNLYESEHTDANYVLPGLVLHDDELFDSIDAVLQVLRSEIGG